MNALVHCMALNVYRLSFCTKFSITLIEWNKIKILRLLHIQPVGLSPSSTAVTVTLHCAQAPVCDYIVLFATHKRTFRRHTRNKSFVIWIISMERSLFCWFVFKKNRELNVCCVCARRVSNWNNSKVKLFNFIGTLLSVWVLFEPRPSPFACLLAPIRLLLLHSHNSAPMSHFSKNKNVHRFCVRWKFYFVLLFVSFDGIFRHERLHSFWRHRLLLFRWHSLRPSNAGLHTHTVKHTHGENIHCN